VFSPARHIGFALQVGTMAFLKTLFFTYSHVTSFIPQANNTHHTTSKTDRFQNQNNSTNNKHHISFNLTLGAWWILHIPCGLLATIVLAFSLFKKLNSTPTFFSIMHQRRMYVFFFFGFILFLSIS